MNTVTRGKQAAGLVRVSTLQPGALVSWKFKPEDKEGIFVVLNYKDNLARIAAVSLGDGGFLTPETLVTPLAENEVVTITVGGAE